MYFDSIRIKVIPGIGPGTNSYKSKTINTGPCQFGAKENLEFVIETF